MSIGRLRVLGLLFTFVACTAACDPSDAEPQVTRADVAVLSYSPPSGAPDFCAALAGSTHLTGLPEALGTLTADPDDVEATLALTSVIGELQDVLEEVRARPGFLALDRALARLTDAVREARDGPLTDPVRAAIGTGLDDVGHQVQPVCDFPT